MSTSKLVPARALGSRTRRQPRWSLYIAPLVLALALVTATASAQETEEEKCSDFTEDNRPCTATEQFGYCLTNAIESFEECWDSSGVIGKLGCTIAYEVDYYACALGLPFLAVKDALK